MLAAIRGNVYSVLSNGNIFLNFIIVSFDFLSIHPFKLIKLTLLFNVYYTSTSFLTDVQAYVTAPSISAA